jgi:hypothetical protein
MKSKRETFLLVVEKGCLVPSDRHTQERMRALGYHVGDVLSATLTKSRNPGFHRLAHAFGQLCADNIDRFTGMNCHAVLKCIQYEADISCDRMMVNLKGFGMVEVRIPKSLSFDSMDEGEFREVYSAMCRHVANEYMTDLDEHQVAQLVEAMPNAA